MDIKERFLTARKKVIENEFKRMNDMQRQAVFTVNGPILILAGAGSGKTTVLVNRIANIMKYGNAYMSDKIYCDISEDLIDVMDMIAEGKAEVNEQMAEMLAVSPAKPWQILAITFTNKAAGEMKDRLEAMLGEAALDIKAGTFHSVCARMLRRDAERIGYTSGFTIYDTSDSRRLVKSCIEELRLDGRFDPKTVQSAISGAKNKMIGVSEFEEMSESDYFNKNVAKIYSLYQQKLKSSNSMDFDDLLLNTIYLFKNNDDILERYQRTFRYIMVDEYQDTNPVQYEFIKLLSEQSRNLCVVGDDDQSIYRFRGATIENILSFEKTYPEAIVIRLEQNYRSTEYILDAANKVIANNKERKGKNLWTDNGKGEKIVYKNCRDEHMEAQFVADCIEENVRNGSKYSDNSVLYRMNVQSREIENVLVRRGIPYRIIGGHKFYDRQEIKDVLAYLRLIVNDADSVSFRRVINTPKRGIGDTSVDKIAMIAEQLGVNMFEVALRADEYQELSRSGGRIKEFAGMVYSWMELNENARPTEVFDRVIEESGYYAMLMNGGVEGKNRLENVKELRGNILNFETQNEESGLEGFLEEISLISDIDNYNADEDAVALMTVHSAKGLEFDNVFIVGMEEGIFPSDLSRFGGESEIEEERRAAYVAITRAKKLLTVTTAERRFLMGKTTQNEPSRFFEEIPKAYVNDLTVRTYAQPKTAFDNKPANKFIKPRATVGISPKPAGSDADGEKFNEGDTVKHPTFGVGVVLSVKPMGNDTLIEIAFDSVGTKKLMQNFIKLKKL